MNAAKCDRNQPTASKEVAHDRSNPRALVVALALALLGLLAIAGVSLGAAVTGTFACVAATRSSVVNGAWPRR
jgi:hypothetical protein